VLTLGHGSLIRGLRLVDLANPAAPPLARTGNVVFVGSRAPGDTIAASVIVTLRLEGNRFEGYLVVTAGVSRPDAVTGSVTSVESRRNLYTRSGFDRHGWLLLGGSSSPHFLDAAIPGASRNQLQVVGGRQP
jgi:hypothetical protein